MAPNSKDDDDFGEEVFTGRVKAATLPMGGPASRRVKKKVEGGPIAKGWQLLCFLNNYLTLFSLRRVSHHLRSPADPGLGSADPGHASALPPLLHQSGPGNMSPHVQCLAVSCLRNMRESSSSG